MTYEDTGIVMDLRADAGVLDNYWAEGGKPSPDLLHDCAEQMRAAADEIERLRKWEGEVIAALEGLPDNTAPDAIRVLREQVGA